MSIVISLPKRSGQSSPISINQYDATMTTIENAFLAVGAGSGSVTSVGLTAPSIFAVANSPITGAGSIALTLNTQAANTFFAGPAAGSATPTFRVIAVGDLPSIPVAKGGTGAVSFTASRLIVSDGSGNLASSAVTSTEAGFLSGVSSAIQTQLNAKQATIVTLPVANGGTGASTAQTARLALLPTVVGNALKTLRVNAGATDVEWAVISSGISTINGNANTNQTIAVDATGTDFSLASVGGATTISLPDAGAAARGVVSTGAQSFNGVKTFLSAPVITAGTSSYITYYGSSKELSGDGNFTIDATKEQANLKRISVDERQIALGYNGTEKTADYVVDAAKDYIIYTNAAGGNIAVSLPDTGDPNTELGAIYRIVKTTAANNVMVKTQGSDTIDDGFTTSVSVVAVKGWVDIQAVKSGLYRILSSKIS